VRPDDLRPGQPVPLPLPPGSGVPPVSERGAVVPLRPYGVGEMYRGMGRVLRAAPASVTAAALLAFAVAAAAELAAGPSETVTRVASGDATHAVVTHLRVGPLAVAELALLAAPVAAAVLVPLVLRLVAGQSEHHSADDVLRRGWRATLASLAIVLLGLPQTVLALAYRSEPGLAVLGLLLTPLALWVQVRLRLMPAVAVAEDVGLVTAARRSWDLVGGSWWRTFGLYLAFDAAALVQGAISGAATAVSIAGLDVGSSASTPERPLAAVLALFVLLSVPMSLIGGVLLYVDLRCRREGLAWQLQAARTTPAREPFGRGGTYELPPWPSRRG
jgi:hypothetical protein